MRDICDACEEVILADARLAHPCWRMREHTDVAVELRERLAYLAARGLYLPSLSAAADVYARFEAVHGHADASPFGFLFEDVRILCATSFAAGVVTCEVARMDERPRFRRRFGTGVWLETDPEGDVDQLDFRQGDWVMIVDDQGEEDLGPFRIVYLSEDSHGNFSAICENDREWTRDRAADLLTDVVDYEVEHLLNDRGLGWCLDGVRHATHEEIVQARAKEAEVSQ